MTPKILLVDDLADSLALLDKMLLRHMPHCEVLTATNGKDAIEIAKRESLDLILLDAKMPNMDGFEVCRQLKADRKTTIVPVLMVSGVLVETRDRVAGLETGADGYICKPFEQEELIAQVNSLLRIKRAEDELRRREQDLEKELAARTRNLMDSEQRFRALFEKSPDAIFVEDINGIVLDVNPAACRIHDLPREELIGKNVLDLVPENERARVQRDYPKWFSGEIKSVEGTSLARNGHAVPVELRANRVTYNSRQAIMLIVRDVSARREAEHALQMSEARYRALVEDQTDLICRIRPDGTFVFANRAYCVFAGREEHELVNQSLLPLLPEGERSRVMGHLQGLTPDKPVQHIEHLATAGDGRVRWQQWINRGIFDRQGRLLEIQSSGRDITEHKLAEEHQNASSLWLRAVVDIADDLIACPDLDTLFRQAVELARSRLGLERCGIVLKRDDFAWGTYGTDLDGKTSGEHNHRIPLDDQWRERFRLKKPDEPRWTVAEEEYRGWDGQEMLHTGRFGPIASTPIQTASKSIGIFFNDNALTGTPLDPARQEIVAVYCSLLGNIAERKASEAERDRLAAAVDQSAESVVITDADRVIRYVNPGFARIMGYSRDEATGQKPDFLNSGRHPPDFFDGIWAQVLRGDVWTGRIISRRKDGTLVETEQTISPVRDGAGQIVDVLSVAQDVTRSVQMEAELRQSQKMESVGRLAGGIAHDFNNLLTAILGFSRLIQSEVGEGHPANADAQEIINAGERAAKLTRQLLAFGRKQLLQMQPLDLNAIVMNMDQLLRRTLGEDIELVTVCGDGLGSIEADAGLLEQVVMNLAVNARDAMPKGGKLTLTTSRVALDEEYCRRHVGVKPGDFTMLSVRDIGCGMTDHVREHAFEPFFTTKEKGKGSGLGLSTVYGIVKQCHGHIELQSAENQGTEFKIYFPRDTAEPQKIPPTRETPAPRGKETILVVEDEGTVRRLTRRNLESLGYRVLEARHGEDALRVYQAHPDAVNLVLTDVVMPCMGGPELVERLRALNPKVNVLYMSGFTEDIMLDRVHVEHAASLILKPFTLEALAHSVRQALDDT